MPHSLAYYGKGDALFSGNACPGVPGTIHGKRIVQPKFFSDNLQVAVYTRQGTQVLPSMMGRRTGNNGEQVGRRGGGMILVQHALHARFPMHGQLLICLFPAIVQDIALDILFLQEGNVHKRHATGIETEKERKRLRDNGRRNVCSFTRLYESHTPF